jgi:2-(1,2-epoxy-1,2-dihydrophenyl)acetyl-CoA isomerase
MADLKTVTYDLQEGVAFIRFNQPETLNAFDPQMAHDTNMALDRAAGEARAIVLGGHGRGFSSGAKLAADTFNFDDPDIDAGTFLDTHFNPMMRRLRLSKIPVVSAVKGVAAGIGASIALMADVIIVGTGTKFVVSFCKIGLVPDGGAPYLLAKSIGRVRAMELMLLGEPYSAEQALADGMITRITAPEQVEDEALAIAKKLAKGPTLALQMIRDQAWAALEISFNDQLALEREYQRIASRTEDFREGVTAFQEKRPPLFKGR